MKLLNHILVVPFVLAGSWAFSQNTSKWDFGLSSTISHERFAVRQSMGSPVASYKYKRNSDFSFGVGFWSEFHFSERFSTVSDLHYSIVKISDNIYTGGISKDNYGDVIEVHHYTSFSERLRYYFGTTANRKLFADIGLKLDRTIFFKTSYFKQDSKQWNPKHLKNLDPAVVSSFGIRKNRWLFSVQYQYFLGTAFAKKYRKDQQNAGIEWDVNRQNFSFAAAFNFVRKR